MTYIRCSSTFTNAQEAFLRKVAISTNLFTVDDIVSYKRSCYDVAEVQRLVDFLNTYYMTSAESVVALFGHDAKFAHYLTKLKDLIKGDMI